MLYFKILLALFLSAIPVVFKHLVLPKKDTSPSCRNLFSAVGSARPALKKWRRKSFNISIIIYNAMKHSLEARKLFSFTLLLVLLTVVMVDFNASANVARKVMKIAHDNDSQVERLTGLYTVYSPYLTFRYATLLAGLMVIPFFSYRMTDKILLKLSLNRRWFIAICSLTLLLLGLCAFHSSGTLSSSRCSTSSWVPRPSIPDTFNGQLMPFPEKCWKDSTGNGRTPCLSNR